MAKVVAVTGATGFIGSAVARRLHDEGWTVRVLCREGSSRARLGGVAVQWIPGDLDDFGALRRLVEGTEAVVHCAGVVRGAEESRFQAVNASGVARLAQISGEQAPRPRFLLMSSLAAREPSLSHYAASKRQGERALAEAAESMSWTVLRPPAVYGPGDREMLPLLRGMYRGVAPVVGTKGARFSLLYVDDLADAVASWLRREAVSGQIYELHDGRAGGYAWQDVLEAVGELRGGRVLAVRVPAFLVNGIALLNQGVARLTGRSPMLTPGKVRELQHPDWTCDNLAITRDIGWTPRVTLTDGLHRTLCRAA